MSRHKKKTFIPLLGLTIVSWGFLGALGYLVEPTTVKDVLIPGGYVPFFGLCFLAVFFLITLVFNNMRRGFLFGLGVTGFLLLRLMRLGNIVNELLLLAFVAVIEYYFSSR